MVVQIGQNRGDRGAERRTGGHRVGRRAAQPAPTVWAPAAKNPNPRDDRPDRRQLNVIIGMPQRLAIAANDRAAMRTTRGMAIDGPVRGGRKGSRDARTITLAPRRPVTLLPARRRQARVARCLRRLPELRLQRCHALQQRQDQRVFLFRTQAAQVGRVMDRLTQITDLNATSCCPELTKPLPAAGARPASRHSGQRPTP